MSPSLPAPPAQHFIDEVLLAEWDADIVDTARGFDPAATPGTQAFIPVARTVDNVGQVHPSLVVSYSNETTPSQSTYDFVTPDGPGQNRFGTLVAVARAQDTDDGSGYTGDPSQHPPQDAADTVVSLVEAVEDVCLNNPVGGSSAFEALGSQRGPEQPPADDDNPTVRMANVQISYYYRRLPGS